MCISGYHQTNKSVSKIGRASVPHIIDEPFPVVQILANDRWHIMMFVISVLYCVWAQSRPLLPSFFPHNWCNGWVVDFLRVNETRRLDCCRLLHLSLVKTFLFGVYGVVGTWGLKLFSNISRAILDQVRCWLLSWTLLYLFDYWLWACSFLERGRTNADRFELWWRIVRDQSLHLAVELRLLMAGHRWVFNVVVFCDILRVVVPNWTVSLAGYLHLMVLY